MSCGVASVEGGKVLRGEGEGFGGEAVALGFTAANSGVAFGRGGSGGVTGEGAEVSGPVVGAWGDGGGRVV